MRNIIISGFDGFGRCLKDQVVSDLSMSSADTACLFALDASDAQKAAEQFEQIVMQAQKSASENENASAPLQWVFLNDDLHSDSARNLFRLIEEKKLQADTMVVCGISLPAARAAVRFAQDVDTLEELKNTIKAEAEAGFQVIFP